MNEQEPKMSLTVDGEVLTVNRLNGCLYTFLGEASMYDHIFVITGENEKRQAVGKYIFSLSDIYPEVKAFMTEHRFQGQLNMPAAPPCDITAFENRYYEDVRQQPSFPMDWIPQQRQSEQ